ncbi:MAG: hypothetical protein KJZ86_00990 [Caldilineaceae bacterium]|nr:hypothetical protein [Caldilineaceae bacterium]HRJ40542.1 hypothetical protein [Caldilineaceae bacterium]
MNYLRCIQNSAYIQFGDEPVRDQPLASLTVGYIYKTLPPTPDEQRLGEVRIIDNEGEDYLYPVDYFESVPFDGGSEATATTTVHLDPVTKGILRAEAIAAKTSVSALLRAWIDERLDLPVTQ